MSLTERVASSTSRRNESLALGVVLLIASSRLIAKAIVRGQLLGDESPLLYQAGTLGFNYFQFGAVRRGLGGSMAYLLSGNLLIATAAFHLVWAAAVAACAALLFRCMDAPPSVRWSYALVAVGIMLRWAEDAGRTDIAIAALLAAATLAMQSRRLDLAVAIVALGLFIHESSVIFGLPLLAALWHVQGGWRAFDRGVAVRAGVVFAVGLAAYAFMGLLPHADVLTMAKTVRSKLPPHEYVDWAIYFAISGMRGVAMSMCQNRTDPSYIVHPFGGVLMLLLAGVALTWRTRDDWRPMALAALPGFAFLCVVANDTARWTMFAAFNMWLVGVSIPRVPGRRSVAPWVAVLAALLIAPLVNPKPDKIQYPIYAGSPAIEWLVRKLHGPRTPSIDEALLRCDPQWRTVLGDRPVP